MFIPALRYWRKEWKAWLMFFIAMFATYSTWLTLWKHETGTWSMKQDAFTLSSFNWSKDLACQSAFSQVSIQMYHTFREKKTTNWCLIEVSIRYSYANIRTWFIGIWRQISNRMPVNCCRRRASQTPNSGKQCMEVMGIVMVFRYFLFYIGRVSPRVVFYFLPLCLSRPFDYRSVSPVPR